jgi:hypothetical protein
VPWLPQVIWPQVPPAPLSMQLAPQVQLAMLVQEEPKLQPPEELPLDEPPHGQPVTQLPPQQHPPLHVWPFGCPEHGLPPLLLPDPPEELPLEHMHEPHAQLELHTCVPLQVPVLQAVVAPGLQAPLPTQLPHWPDELHVSLPQLPQGVVLPTAHCPVQLPFTHVWLRLVQSVEAH